MKQMNRQLAHKQSGFSLLEVLIALLVLSIGLLGLAALQTTGLRSNQMASMRTTATQMAYDITDRMRANPQAVADTTNKPYVVNNTTHPTIVTDCTTTDCTAAQLATFDLAQWKTTLATTQNGFHGLPGGLGEITQTAGPPLTHTITVRWDQDRTGATGLNCPPQDENDLRCFRLVFSE